jgi:glutamine synthetase
MAKIKFEYIWLDGYKPEPSLRSKTKVLDLENYNGEIAPLPIWSFDGSSTQQAEGHSSDCLMKPVSVYPDPQRQNAFLVITEVLNPDHTPHSTNHRALIENDSEDFWFGWEQEYVLMQNGKPLGFPAEGYPAPQGPYYCAVGNGKTSGREIVEEHLDACIAAGINITGVNAEVMLGQWEYQVLGKGGKQGSDDLILSRYLLERICEGFGVDVDLQPKPVKGDWNGSGMHCNFSNKAMREIGGEDLFKAVCESFRPVHDEHIAVYGSKNEERLTGLHETQSIHEFSYGVSDRGASIRIPVSTAETWLGYLEDRRPASNANPYQVSARIMKTVNGASVMA